MAKEAKAKKVYVSTTETDGKQSYFPEAEKLEFRFANGETVAVDPNEFDDSVRTAAMFHGLSQKLGDAYAGTKDAEDAHDKFMAMLEQIQSGNWLAERESAGPRISLIVQAIVAAKAAQGVEVSEKDVAETYQAMPKERQKTVLKDARINAEYQRIRAEQAAARAAKAAQAADSAETDDPMPI
jgi:hypothetical protein